MFEFEDDGEEFEQAAKAHTGSESKIWDQFASISDEELAAIPAWSEQAQKTNLFREVTSSNKTEVKKPKQKIKEQLAPIVFDASEDHEFDVKKSKRNHCSIAIRVQGDNGFEKLITKLPLCDPLTQILSSDVLVRCALFGLGTHHFVPDYNEQGAIISKKKRKTYSEEAPKDCGVYAGVSVKYVGRALGQPDFDVYSHLLVNAKDDLTKPFQISLYSILKALGRSDSKEGVELLKYCLARLRGGLVIVKSEGVSVSFNLLRDFKYDENKKLATVEFHQSTAVLFSTMRNMGWSRLAVAQRRSIRSELALWLHAFYSSHRNPIPLRVDQLMVLCNSSSQRKEFKRCLKSALDELKSDKVGFLTSWSLLTGGEYLKVVRAHKQIEETRS